MVNGRHRFALVGPLAVSAAMNGAISNIREDAHANRGERSRCCIARSAVWSPRRETPRPVPEAGQRPQDVDFVNFRPPRAFPLLYPGLGASMRAGLAVEKEYPRVRGDRSTANAGGVSLERRYQPVRPGPLNAMERGDIDKVSGRERNARKSWRTET